MTRVVALVGAIAVTGALAFAQTAAPTGIRGRVIAGDTGLPVRNAIVVLAPIGSTATPVMSDGDGRFEFKDIAAGRYILRVTKTGFVPMYFDLQGVSNVYFEIKEGQQIDRGDVRLPKAGVIAGRVFDNDGDPAAEVSVTAWRVNYLGPGERQMVTVKSVETNDLGDYRLFGLAPGKYDVSAAIRGTVISAGESGKPTAGSIGSAGQAPTFYPGTANGLDAQPVFVRVNEDSPGTNIRMQALQFTRVSGTVHDSSGRPARDVVVMVNPSRADGASYFSATMTEADASGRFVIPGVPPGEYRVDVQPKARLEAIGRGGSLGAAWAEPGESASVPITVTGDPMLPLSVTLSAGSRITGRVLIDDAPATPAAAPNIQVMVVPVAQERGISWAFQTGGGPVRPDGSFVVLGVHGPRLIRVTGVPAAMRLQRVVANGADVTDRGFDFGSGDISGVEIRVTTKLSIVSGVVNEASGSPARGSTVIVYSEDRQDWSNSQNRRVTFTVASQSDGRFGINGLPAGNYLAVAVSDADRGQWADPDNLERWRAVATRFTLGEGDKRELTLVRR